jgi:hypothetical protein
MTDPQTTTTRDEAVLDHERIPTWPPLKKALWDVVTGEKLNDGHYINAYQLTDKLYAAAVDRVNRATDAEIGGIHRSLASAPAPASGGVDAVAAVVAEELALKIVSLSVNWLREDGTDREHENYVRANWTKEIAEAKRLILAALSPAATPVSEAGGELHHASGERITRKDLNDAYRKGAEDGRLATKLIDGMRPEALAKPASSPAGGDVREALQKLYDGGVACHDLWFFKELEQIIAALSQSTSAGRVGE